MGTYQWLVCRTDQQVFVPHGARRLARMIVSAVSADHDFRSMQAFTRVATPHASRGTFRGWCRAEGLAGRAALDFARLLRAVHVSALADCDFTECVDIADVVTLRRLLARGGLQDVVPIR